jgi:hypothetical protein
MVPFAVLTKAIKVTAKAIYLGDVSAGCMDNDPLNYEKCVSKLRDTCEGRDPEVNKLVKAAIPTWLKKAGELLVSGDAKLEQWDAYMVDQYRTIPGIVHDGLEGMIDVALPSVTTLGFRATKTVVKGLNEGIKTTAKIIQQSIPTPAPAVIREHRLRFFLRNEAGGQFLPRELVQHPITAFMKDESGFIRIPSPWQKQALLDQKIAETIAFAEKTAELEIQGFGATFHQKLNFQQQLKQERALLIYNLFKYQINSPKMQAPFLEITKLLETSFINS